MKLKKAIVVCSCLILSKKDKTLEAVRGTLTRKGIKFKVIDRDKLKRGDYGGCDIVIAVGGDGTFIKASHFAGSKIPLLGVNPEPEKQEGFFARAAKEDFEEKLEYIISGKEKILKLARLQAKVNGKDSGILCLNEFYFGRLESYLVSRYRIKAMGKEEEQKSSGVIVGTASGSYGWLNSCIGLKMPMEMEKMQFCVREPIFGRVSNATLIKGVLEKNETITIKNHDDSAILIADSFVKIIKIKENDVIRIGLSKSPLLFVDV